jgi:putative transposase
VVAPGECSQATCRPGKPFTITSGYGGKDGLWERLNQVLREKVRRQQHKKKSQASATILDSQSIKTSEGGLECGFDAGKKITGRKRHTLVDTLGLLMKVVVTAGNVQDRDGAKLLLEDLAEQEELIQRLELIWADGGYRGTLISWVEETFGWKLEIVEKPEGQIGFQVLPKRWVVERTFAWLVRQRRLARDYERQALAFPCTSLNFLCTIDTDYCPHLCPPRDTTTAPAAQTRPI